MHILMPCAIDVWALTDGAGAPSLHKTLRGYGERGHRITFVGVTIGANHFMRAGRLRGEQVEPPPEIPGVTFKLFHLPSVQESRLPLPEVAASLDQKLRFALLYPPLAARAAGAVLEREQVDLLYGYEVHGVLAARLVRRRHRLPMIARFMGTDMMPTLTDPLLRWRRYEEVLALRAPADLFIMTDDGSQGDQVLAGLNPASAGKVRFWRNGLDLHRLYPPTMEERREARQRLGLADDAFIMVTASRLTAWKKLERAVGAMPQVLRSVPNALLVLVGDGEERPKLERLARRLGVSDSVRISGSVRQEVVGRYMHAADLFLAVADLTNVGNPLLEAMACGMPVVTINGGDTRVLVHDGETGRLLPSGEETAIAQAIVGLAQDTEERSRLGAGARRYGDEHFWTWPDRINAELDVVERLVGEGADSQALGSDGHG